MGVFSEIAILGPGLLGGSLALALREKEGGTVRFWARREEAATEVLDLGIVDVASTDLETIVSGADLVVLATPIGAMEGLCRQFLPFLKPGCLITDVGSVKASVCRALGPLCEEGDALFIGSHPMAGSEKTGVRHARPDLFEGAAVVITPESGTPLAETERLNQFWESLGGKVVALSAEDHDRRVAAVSHLPHLISAAAILGALADDPSSAELAGAGLGDTTRIAGGHPGMWTEILLENREAVVPALRSFGDRCGEILAILEQGDEVALSRFLEDAKDLRDTAFPPKPHDPEAG